MTIEKGKISGLGLGILITCFMQGSLLLTAFTDKITMNGTWIVTLTGYIASLPFILAYIRLAKKFHGKNLVQINDIIYGRYLGKIISAAYIWLFIEICTLSLYGMGNFINAIMLNRTPILVLYTAFILVCAWAVRGGIEVIARCCFILLIITSLDIFTTFVFLLKDMHFSNFLPLFDVPVQNYIQGTQIMFSIPFAELIVFMMIFAYINNASKLKRSVMLGFTGGTISIFIIVIRNTATLGPLVSIISFPSFHAASLINIGEVFTRLEILVASAFMITIFIKICVFYYAAILGIAQVFKLSTYVHLVLPLGVIIVSYALFIYISGAEESFYASNTHWAYVVPHQVIFPLMSLVIAKIRKLPAKGEGK